MFKFDSSQTLTHKPLGANDKSSVYPYMEDLDESKWVVKCLQISNHEELSYTSQNILITSTASYASLVPIKGQDIQKDPQGETIIYIKMPRMQKSLKDVIQIHQEFNQGPISVEEIVQYYYSIASSLHELARKGIAHRNIKPTNILIDTEGHIYLSDLKMAQSSLEHRHEGLEMVPMSHLDSFYKAPETFCENWAQNEENFYKADMWSLGILITQLCLLGDFIPVSSDLPIGENKEIIEQNLIKVQEIYGEDLAGILRKSLILDIVERASFRNIQSLLQEAFTHLKLGQLKDTESQISWSNEIIGLMEQECSIDIRDTSSLREKSSLIKGDISSIEKGIELQNNSFTNFSGVNKLLNGLRKGKEFVKSHKRLTFTVLAFLVLIIIVSLPLLSVLTSMGLEDITGQERFTDVMRGIQHKYRNHFKINFDETGMVDVEGVWNNSDPKTMNMTDSDEIVWNLMNDLTTQLESSNDTYDYVQDFRFAFEGDSNLTNATLYYLQNSIVKMMGLRRLAIEQINGPLITNDALQNLLSNVSPYLEDLTIGLLQHPNSFSVETHNVVRNALRNAKRLTAFNLFLDHTELNDHDLQQLEQEFTKNGNHLKTLNIRIQYPHFGQTSRGISSAGLKDFNSLVLSNLTHLTDLGLNFNGAPVTDDVLAALATSITSFGKNLQSINLTISDCNITDSGLKSFGSQLSKEKLKNLALLEIRTPPMSRISNETLLSLIDQLSYIPEVNILP